MASDVGRLGFVYTNGRSLHRTLPWPARRHKTIRGQRPRISLKSGRNRRKFEGSVGDQLFLIVDAAKSSALVFEPAATAQPVQNLRTTTHHPAVQFQPAISHEDKP